MILWMIYNWLHGLVVSEFTARCLQLRTEDCLSAALEPCTMDLSSGEENRLALLSPATLHSACNITLTFPGALSLTFFKNFLYSR